MTDQTESVKGHANSIKTGQKAVSIDRMPKHIDENNRRASSHMNFYGYWFLQEYFLQGVIVSFVQKILNFINDTRVSKIPTR